MSIHRANQETHQLFWVLPTHARSSAARIGSEILMLLPSRLKQGSAFAYHAKEDIEMTYKPGRQRRGSQPFSCQGSLLC